LLAPGNIHGWLHKCGWHRQLMKWIYGITIAAFQHFLLAFCSAGHWLTKRNINYIHRH
jgi:hypothetical protein